MRNTAKPISPLIKEFLKTIGASKRKKQQELSRAWPGIIGEKYAARTRLVGIKQNILQVEVESSVLLHELANFKKRQILRQLQARYPDRHFRDINFLTGAW